MDNKTIEAYNTMASEVAGLHSTLVPEKIYQLIQKYFIKKGKTIDVGCGIGRDCQWLLEHGYAVKGVDASKGMLEQAQKNYKQINVSKDSLPLLETIKNEEYDNVLCSAVIMHLKENQIKSAVENLLRITTVGGNVILSYRSTSQTDKREGGKLYTDIGKKNIVSLFLDLSAKLLHSETNTDTIRNIIWTNIAFKKLTNHSQ